MLRDHLREDPVRVRHEEGTGAAVVASRSASIVSSGTALSKVTLLARQWRKRGAARAYPVSEADDLHSLRL